MDASRREFVTVGGLLAALAAAGSKAAELQSGLAWNREAFEAKTVADALRALGVAVARDGVELEVTAPEIAEDGAVVPVVVQCRAAGTREIHILVDRNPFSLAASFLIPDGTEPFVSTRIKMRETADVIALAVAGGQSYLARKQVKVTVGGCGG